MDPALDSRLPVLRPGVAAVGRSGGGARPSRLDLRHLRPAGGGGAAGRPGPRGGGSLLGFQRAYDTLDRLETATGLGASGLSSTPAGCHLVLGRRLADLRHGHPGRPRHRRCATATTAGRVRRSREARPGARPTGSSAASPGAPAPASPTAAADGRLGRLRLRLARPRRRGRPTAPRSAARCSRLPRRAPRRASACSTASAGPGTTTPASGWRRPRPVRGTSPGARLPADGTADRFTYAVRRRRRAPRPGPRGDGRDDGASRPATTAGSPPATASPFTYDPVGRQARGRPVRLPVGLARPARRGRGQGHLARSRTATASPTSAPTPATGCATTTTPAAA